MALTVLASQPSLHPQGGAPPLDTWLRCPPQVPAPCQGPDAQSTDTQPSRLQTCFLPEVLTASPASPTIGSSGLIASSGKPSLPARTTSEALVCFRLATRPAPRTEAALSSLQAEPAGPPPMPSL